MPSAGIPFAKSCSGATHCGGSGDHTRPEPMKPKSLVLVAGITAALSCSAFGQQDEKLGKLSFPTSCDPKVQAEFERGVAMIHSYWFLIARRTFEGVLREDPSCAIASRSTCSTTRLLWCRHAR